jgi:hypothetical protein
MNFLKVKEKQAAGCLAYNSTYNKLVLMLRQVILSKWDSYNLRQEIQTIYLQGNRFPRTNIDYDRVNIGFFGEQI